MPIPSDVEAIIQKFEQRTDKGMFPNLKVSRKGLAKQLRERIEYPQKINQKDSSLCGPAAFMYCLVKKRPKVYAQYIIDLYEKGEGSIGRIQVKPRKGCTNYEHGDVKLIEDADWISLAGLRDSENRPSKESQPLKRYDHPNDQVSGITMPYDIARWFAQADFLAIRQNTNILFDKNLDNLIHAHQLYISGAFVCLFIGSNFLQGFPGGKMFPNHWVVLTSPVIIGGKSAGIMSKNGKGAIQKSEILYNSIYFKVYTWGDETYPINRSAPNLTVGYFLDYFYGYVAAR